MHRNLYKISTSQQKKDLKGDPYIGVCNQALETLERL